jgi:hypothetical protein
MRRRIEGHDGKAVTGSRFQERRAKPHHALSRRFDVSRDIQEDIRFAVLPRVWHANAHGLRQHVAHQIANTWRCRFTRPGHVQLRYRVHGQETRHFFRTRPGVDVQPRLAQQLCKRGDAHRFLIESRVRREDQRCVAVAHIPLNALQVVLTRRFLQLIAVQAHAFLGTVPMWTPAAVPDPMGDRPVECPHVGTTPPGQYQHEAIARHEHVIHSFSYRLSTIGILTLPCDRLRRSVVDNEETN